MSYYQIINWKTDVITKKRQTLVKAISSWSVLSLGQLLIDRCCIFQAGILTRALCDRYLAPRMSNSLRFSAFFVNCSKTLSVCAFCMIAVEKSLLKGILNSSRKEKPPVVEPAVDDVNVMFAALKTLKLGQLVCSWSTAMDAVLDSDSTFDMSNNSRFGQNSCYFNE